MCVGKGDLNLLSKRNLVSTILPMQAELKELKEENAKLKAELARRRKNSSTSSNPPSSDIVKRKRPTAKKEKRKVSV